MAGSQFLQIKILGFSAYANGEVAIFALVAVALAFIFTRAMRKR